MNYPNYIYKNYEIAEKDIYGEKHYALVRVYNFLGLKWRRHLKVYDGINSSWVSEYSGYTWHNKRYVIESAIESQHKS